LYLTVGEVPDTQYRVQVEELLHVEDKGVREIEPEKIDMLGIVGYPPTAVPVTFHGFCGGFVEKLS